MPDSEMPDTLEGVVDQIVAGLDEESRDRLLNCSKSDLSGFHDGWGTGIRNDFGLHGANCKLLKDCGSESMHFDDASSVIMNAVWNRLHNIPIGDARIENYRFWADRVHDLGLEEVYRMSRFRSSGRRERRQTIYRRLKMFFDLSYKEFQELSNRIDAEDNLPAESGR